MPKILPILALAFTLAGCGTVWTISGFGLSLSVAIPVKPVATAPAFNVATQPAK